MHRLQTREQFQAVMAAGTVSRTTHFVLHRCAPHTLQLPSGPWLGALLPKRWARRAVTRNGIRRQIFAVGQSCPAALGTAAHVVRLRAAFDTRHFISAWSEPLKAAVRAELLTLFSQVQPLESPATATNCPAS